MRSSASRTAGQSVVPSSRVRNDSSEWSVPFLLNSFRCTFLILGRRIKNVHLKEFSKKGTDHSLESFRTLLDGTTDWPAVLEALDRIGYDGYLTFEYFHPFQH